jgi:hypothetical protein
VLVRYFSHFYDAEDISTINRSTIVVVWLIVYLSDFSSDDDTSSIF